ncbi:hypothetical protein GTQ34_15965 [Muricauda sp. JGD-17]|uniref:Uncharacterized protein n=1 Tax=Flagellimonas ochracea TaxID=2696472 RepID=A0A964TEL8_9FLAO|nr:hypothetical protein [Allomuricauda ochracea]NAY93407.1 hypothetical protein [Allomuricauda ochracea]
MRVKGKVIPGYGVASGKGGDPRYHEGTLKLQYPHFKEKGLDLSPFYMGTLNVNIAPYRYQIIKPKLYFENIAWSDHIPPENFYFFDVSLHFKGKRFGGLVYMPDPQTKEDHLQKPTVLELILPKINGLHYGDNLYVNVPEEQLGLIRDA